MKRTLLLAAAVTALALPLIAQAQPYPTRPLGPGASRGPELPQGREDQLDPSPIDPAKDPDVDMFLGDYRTAQPRTLFGALVVRDILTKLEGPDRLRPTRRGAVLEVENWISHATVAPGATARGRADPDSRVMFYTSDGVGKITVRGQSFDLKEGSSFTLTPEFDFTLENTGQTPLTFIARSEPLPENYTPPATFAAPNRFTADRRVGIHWAHIGNAGIQTIAPYSIPQPHSHHNEEIWIQVKGESILSIGKHLRRQEPGMAIKVPPTGLTAHSSINIGSEPVQLMVVIPWGRASEYDFAQLDGTAFNPDKDPDVDMYIGHWRDAFPRIMHGNLYFRDMLTAFKGTGPEQPTRKGAVLTHADAVSYAQLEPGSTARRIDGQLKDVQQVFVVNSGTGSITSGGKTTALSKGMTFVITPGLDFQLTATGTRYMDFYVVGEKIPAGVTPSPTLIVTDHRAAPQVTNSWVNKERPLITKADGLVQYKSITAAQTAPMAMSHPYSVAVGGEEIWIATENDIDMLLGKQMRKLPAGTAFRVPSTGKTANAKLNFTSKPSEAIYFAK
jgi:mannose-6-phosphate isomerase-like protein (cupin superfamily)